MRIRKPASSSLAKRLLVFCLTLALTPFYALGRPGPRPANELPAQSVRLDQVGKLSPDLVERLGRARAADERIKVILDLAGEPGSEFQNYLANSGSRVIRRFQRLNCIVADLPAGRVQELGRFGEVQLASVDGPIESLGWTQPGFGHIEITTGASQVIAPDDDHSGDDQGGLDGSGIAIAVVDSGIDANQAALRGPLGSRLLASVDFTGERRIDDPYGHGTFVASQIAGSNHLYNGKYGGVAPGASLVNLRVLDSTGAGSVSNVIAALEWILANGARYKVRVVNLSLGSAAIESYLQSPLCRAVRQLVNAGFVVLAAAGNDGKDANGNKIYGAIHSPGNEPSAITVGASNTFGTNARYDDVVTTYSSRGPTRSFWVDQAGTRHYDNLIKPDIVAPGNKIVGAEAANNLLVHDNPQLDAGVSSGADSRMMYLSGTSVSTAIASGAAALILESNPALTPNLVKVLLEYSAQPLAGFNTLEQGTGELNVEGAVRIARSVRRDIGPNTTPGSPLLTGWPPLPFTFIAGFPFIWAQGANLSYTYGTGISLITEYQAVYKTGNLLSDGVSFSDGVAFSDALLSGVALGDGIMLSDGGPLGDGTEFAPSSILLGDGIMLSDGVSLGDGILTSDIVLLGDGVLLADSAQAQVVVTGDNTSFMQ